MRVVLGSLVVLFVLLLAIGALTGRITARPRCAPSLPEKDRGASDVDGEPAADESGAAVVEGV